MVIPPEKIRGFLNSLSLQASGDGEGDDLLDQQAARVQEALETLILTGVNRLLKLFQSSEEEEEEGDASER